MKKLLGIIAFLSSGIFAFLYRKSAQSTYTITCQRIRVSGIYDNNGIDTAEVAGQMVLKQLWNVSETEASTKFKAFKNTLNGLANTKIPGLEYSTEQEANSAYDKLKASGAFSMLLIYKSGSIIRNS